MEKLVGPKLLFLRLLRSGDELEKGDSLEVLAVRGLVRW